MMRETIKDTLTIAMDEFEKKHEGELLYEEPTFRLRWVQKENEKVLQQLFTQRYVSGVIDNRYKEVWKDIPVIEGE